MDERLVALKKQIREWIWLDYIVPEDIPDIELYMDQVTTFMDNHLQQNKRNDEDKTLTKTMINNYTKNKLLPPPEKKRYSKEHIIILIYIYYLKNVISINDIQNLLSPMIDRFFQKPEDSKETKTLYEIYNFIFELEKSQYFNIESSVTKAAALTEKKFPKDEDEYLNKMAFIYLLSYDIYSKKRLIEKLIDELSEEEASKSDQKDAGKKEATKKEAVKKEATRKEAVKADTARKEAAKKEAAQREAAKKARQKSQPQKDNSKK
jgi:hypothetical protein